MDLILLMLIFAAVPFIPLFYYAIKIGVADTITENLNYSIRLLGISAAIAIVIYWSDYNSSDWNSLIYGLALPASIFVLVSSVFIFIVIAIIYFIKKGKTDEE